MTVKGPWPQQEARLGGAGLGKPDKPPQPSWALLEPPGCRLA